MTQPEAGLGDEPFQALMDITLRTGTRSFNQQKRAYEAWLGKYIPLAEAQGLTEDVPRMRRLVAEWLLSEAAEARRPAHAFEPLFRDMERLGWEDLQQKTLKIGVVCRYFADRMWQRQGLRYLLPLKREVQREYARTGENMWANYLDWLGRIEERLRARRRPF